MAGEGVRNLKHNSVLITFYFMISSIEISNTKIINFQDIKENQHALHKKLLQPSIPHRVPKLPSPQHPVASTYETLSVVVGADNKQHQRYIQVQSNPSIYPPNNVLQIEYGCFPGEVAGLEVDIWTSYDRHVLAAKHYWPCREQATQEPRRLSQKIKLPDSMVYQPDYLNRKVLSVNRTEISVWVLSVGSFRTRKKGYFDLADAKAKYSVDVRSLYARPRKDHGEFGCLTWETEMRLKYERRWNQLLQCQRDEEMVQLMTFPVAFASVSQGLTRQLPPVREPGLKQLLRSNINEPKYTLSAVIYVLEHCKYSLCGIIHRKTRYTNKYSTPLIFMNQKGEGFVQVEHPGGASSSMLNKFKIPLRQWMQLVFVQDGGKWSFNLYTEDDGDHKIVGKSAFKRTVYYKEQDSLYHLGGSSAVASFSGFMLDAKVWRAKALNPEKVPKTLFSKLNYTNWIVSYYERCNVQHESMERVFDNMRLKFREKRLETSCPNSNPLLTNVAATHPLPQEPYCNLWQQPAPKRELVLWRLLQEAAFVNSTYAKTHQWLSQQLQQQIVDQLQESGLAAMRVVVPWMKQASCYGNADATAMLATAYTDGLGVKANESKALVYWLIAAQEGSRLAMLVLGNKHQTGLDKEVPLDMDYAFRYFYHVAQETINDRTKHSASDISFESVRLTDTNHLKTQTGEKGDYFKWLKHQAKQGVADAQLTLARMYYHGASGVHRDMEAAAELYRMNAEQNVDDPVAQYDYAVVLIRASLARTLFWGTSGVKRNMKKAVKYYAETAKSHPKNKVALYDYAIVLLRGQGTEKDVAMGLDYLNRSAALGHAPAYTAIGWYKLNMQHDDKNAAFYFEKGDAMGHRDAAHNLGFMHFVGRYPGRPVDRMTAFEYYYKAAKAEHWDSAAKVAELYNHGNEKMPRDNALAAAWARWVAEKNRDVAWALRHGLDAYLKGALSESLVHYIMAAETGLEVAQYNAAHLCEENYDEIGSHVDSDCAWKYWQLAALAEKPHLMSTLKVADYYWYGRGNQTDKERAIAYYVEAGHSKQPQAIYNLAFLLERGVTFPVEVWQSVGVSPDIYNSNDNVTKIAALYRMCRDGSKDAYIPCGLALVNLYLRRAWLDNALQIQLASTILVGIISMVVFVWSVVKIRQRSSATSSLEEPSTTPEVAATTQQPETSEATPEASDNPGNDSSLGTAEPNGSTTSATSTNVAATSAHVAGNT